MKIQDSAIQEACPVNTSISSGRSVTKNRLMQLLKENDIRCLPNDNTIVQKHAFGYGYKYKKIVRNIKYMRKIAVKDSKAC